MKQKLYPLVAVLLLSFLQAVAQTETEPNNSFTAASELPYNIQYTGTIGCSGDADDYFKAEILLNKRVRIYMEYTNTGASNGATYFHVYAKNQGAVVSNRYSGNIAPSATAYDTIDLYCRADDSMYFRVSQSAQCINYKIRYDITAPVQTTAFDNANNDAFATAASISEGDTVRGTIRYESNGVVDDYDYYKTVLPRDGMLRVYIERTNTGSSNNQYFYLTLFEKNQSSFFYHDYNGYVNPGDTRYDTLNIDCRAADTIYFRIYGASSCFSYRLRYEVINNNPANVIDTGGNNSFAAANDFNEGDTIRGTIRYESNGVVDDYDFYKTILPREGTLHIYIERTNTGSSNSQYFYLTLFEKNQSSFFYNDYNGYVDPGDTRYDTLNIDCRAADTIYFRIYGASSCFSYRLRYEVINNNPANAIDTGDNNSFAAANAFNEGDTIRGTIRYESNGVVDYDDYYKTILPRDGKLRVYIERTSTGSSNSQYFYLTLFEKNQSSFFYHDYNGYVNPGDTRYDTLNIDCRTADTIYFRIHTASSCFSYRLRYEVITNNPGNTIDTGDNNSFAAANAFNEGDTIRGTIRYESNGVVDDYDFYKTILPRKGTLRVYIERTNTGSSNSQYFYLTLFEKNQSSFFYDDYNGYINSGVTRYDTVNIYCRAADTIYFRIGNSSSCFSYRLRYEVILGDDTTVNVCPGFTADISDIYNTAPFNVISWTNMGGGAMPPLTAAGQGLYRLTVENTSQSCSRDTAFVSVGWYSKPDLGNDTIANICPGFTADLTQFKDTTGLSVQWLGAADPTAVGAGIYTMIVATVHGCTDTAIITIGLYPKPDLGSDTMANVCPGFTADLTQFKDTTGLSAQWLGAADPTAVGAGTYTMIGTTVHGCTDTAIITIGLHPKPDLGNDTIANICPGFTADLTQFKDTTGLSAQWLDAADPTAVGAGTYTMIGTTVHGCTDTAIITIGLHPKPDLGSDTIANVCPGFMADLTQFKNTIGLATQWQGTSTPVSVGAGTYTLIAANAQGCSDTAVITINSSTPPDLGNDTALYAWIGETVDFVTIKDTTGFAANGWMHSWASSLNGVSGNTAVTITGSDTVYASLRASNQNGCSDTMNITVYPARQIVPPTGITNLSADAEITAPDGWTHYYHTNGTAAKNDDILLLSLKKNGNSIGTTGNGSFMVKNVATQNAGSNTGIQITNPLMSNSSNYYVMHRYWQVIPDVQPVSSVGVRFYFNTQDYNDVNGSFGNTKTIQQLVLYHLKDGNPDPASNWSGAIQPIVSIMNDLQVSDTTWTYTGMGTDQHYAEFTVNSFSGGGAGFTGDNQPLPVTVTSFAAVAKNDDAVIDWHTADESNVARYELQRSEDGRYFSSLYTVNALNGKAASYHYTDAGAGKRAEVLYYRIKVNEANGRQLFTHVSQVRFTHAAHEIILFPNPAKDELTLKGVKDYRDLKVTDIHGKIVLARRITSDTEVMQLHRLAAGIYTVVLTKDGQSQTLKFFKSE